MRFSAGVVRTLAWLGIMALVPAGFALDTAHTTTHPKTASQHLSITHHVRHPHGRTRHRAVARRTTSHVHHTRRAAVAHSHSYSSRRARLRRAHYRRYRHHRYYERFTASSYAQGDIFAGDATAGEDPIVRQAAIDAMGNMNGTAVVINASNGRILAMVNQKLALSPGAEPCSTIKLSVALAALSEGLVTRDTMVKLPGFRMNMTEAIAHSNNLYFEELGRELGFERVHHYANEFGLGELAGWHIAGEQLGEYPDHPIPQSEGGVGRMCSFGQGVSMTPLQLGALVAAIANGGTLYYLQHPTTHEEIADFQPRVKRVLHIAKYIPELQDGMAGAVEFGTARRLRINFRELPVFGKTGTCSNKGTRFGWFGSYSQTPLGPIVAVFFLEGGRPTFGPRAAELAGEFYRNLWDRNYFGDNNTQTARSALQHLQTAGIR
jgi:penicillin-binding protein 2